MSINLVCDAPFICTAASCVLLYLALKRPGRIAWGYFAGAIAALVISSAAVLFLGRIDNLLLPGAVLIGLLSSVELWAGGLVVLVLVPGWHRLWVALMMIAYPAAAFAAYWVPVTYGWPTFAEQYADPIIEALEAYHTQNGHYPEDLSGLVPDYLDAIPEQDAMWGWLYQTSKDEFQLGYVERVDWIGYDVTVYTSRDKKWDDVPSHDNPFRDLPPTPTPSFILSPTP